MWIYVLNGIDEAGNPYDFKNETSAWTLRGLRKGTKSATLTMTWIGEGEARDELIYVFDGQGWTVPTKDPANG